MRNRMHKCYDCGTPLTERVSYTGRHPPLLHCESCLRAYRRDGAPLRSSDGELLYLFLKIIDASGEARVSYLFAGGKRLEQFLEKNSSK